MIIVIIVNIKLKYQFLVITNIIIFKIINFLTFITKFNLGILNQAIFRYHPNVYDKFHNYYCQIHIILYLFFHYLL